MKERLIGAAVLVVIGVWLIPWILDGPEPSSRTMTESQTLELPAPLDAAPLRTQTIDLEERRHASEHSTASAPSQADVGSSAASDTHPQRADGAATAKTEPKSAPEPEPVAAAPVPAAPATSGWFVQLGSFGDEENAGRLATRVTTYGYEAQVSNFRASGRIMHRVRVGPRDSRAEAEAVASSLSAHGFVAQVVTAD